MTETPNKHLDEMGLPRYLEMQAQIGHTKHIGGVDATRELLDLCGAGPGKRVLNVGCGVGRSTVWIVENYGCFVVGVDIKPNMIAEAKKLAERKGISAQTEFRVADAQDLSFEDDSFDILICESVNIFVPDRTKAAAEYRRVVKPGGMVGLSEAILVKQPEAGALPALNEIVGYEMQLPEVWENMLAEVGLDDIVAHAYPLDMRAESRSQKAFFSAGDALRMIGRSIGMLFKDSYTRSLVKESSGASFKEFSEYMGYGVFVGRVPSP